MPRRNIQSGKRAPSTTSGPTYYFIGWGIWIGLRLSCHLTRCCSCDPFRDVRTSAEIKRKPMIANQPNGQYRTQCCGVHYVRFQVTRLARLMTTCGRKAEGQHLDTERSLRVPVVSYLDSPNSICAQGSSGRLSDGIAFQATARSLPTRLHEFGTAAVMRSTNFPHALHPLWVQHRQTG